jgi:hypothetical protein
VSVYRTAAKARFAFAHHDLGVPDVPPEFVIQSGQGHRKVLPLKTRIGDEARLISYPTNVGQHMMLLIWRTGRLLGAITTSDFSRPSWAIALAKRQQARMALGPRAPVLSPQDIYRRLLTRPFPDSELPKGFSSAKVIAYPLAGAQRRLIVGALIVAVHGPDAQDDIEYSVWPTAAAAQRNFGHPRARPGDRIKVIGSVPGYNAGESRLVEGSTVPIGAQHGEGVTEASTVIGNVFVSSIAGSSHNKSHGNKAAALSLFRAGIEHLRAVQR